MTNSHNASSADLLREQNELLRIQIAQNDAQSAREQMRDMARRWDHRASVRLGFVKNPYEKWR